MSPWHDLLTGQCERGYYLLFWLGRCGWLGLPGQSDRERQRTIRGNTLLFQQQDGGVTLQVIKTSWHGNVITPYHTYTDRQKTHGYVHTSNMRNDTVKVTFKLRLDRGTDI